MESAHIGNLQNLNVLLEAARQRNHFTSSAKPAPAAKPAGVDFMAALKKIAANLSTSKSVETEHKNVRPAVFPKVERPAALGPKKKLGNRLDVMA